jgi:hypothetical protein
MQHRPFSLGEGIRGMRPISDPNDEVSDTTGDDKRTERW